MASQNVGKIVGTILAIVIAGIFLGYVFPVGLDAVNQDQSTTISQEVNTEYDVTESLVSEVTNIDDAEETVTVELSDTQTGETTTVTLSEGETQTAVFENGDVSITLDNYDSAEPTLTYEYPSDYEWADSESQIFSVLPIFMVLVPLGVLAAYIMRVM